MSATIKTSGDTLYKVIKPGTSGLSVDDVINSTGITCNDSFDELKLQRVAPPPYLKFTANTAGSTVTLGKNGSPSWTGSYSTDDGTIWVSYVPGTTGAITLTNAGDSVCFKGTYSAAPNASNCLSFSMSGSLAASGNIMSLCRGDNFVGSTTIPYNYCFYRLFYGCSSLTTAPELPATTLAEGCYSSMFYGCSSLTTAPALPATTLKESCYSSMFYGCSSLYVSDTSGTGYDKVWTIPSTGTFTNTYAQSSMFNCCLGTRSSNSMAGASGQSYTYYTQNTPV